MRPPVGRSWIGYAVAIAGVALVSAAIGAILPVTRIANASMLYLVVVLAVATLFGSGPAVLASILAFLAFNWLFVEPLHTFAVSDAEEWLSLLLLLVASVVTGQLAAGQRRRADEARRREQEALQLYSVGRYLATSPTLDGALQEVADYLCNALRLEGCAILLSEADGRLVPRGQSGRTAAAGGETARWQIAVDAGDQPTAQPRRWVRVVPPGPPTARASASAGHRFDLPLRTASQQVGLLRLLSPPGRPRLTREEARLLESAADQVALVVERASLQEEANAAEVLRRTDELRGALLSSVSHDLRTPLASIKAAAGSLRQRDVVWSE